MIIRPGVGVHEFPCVDLELGRELRHDARVRRMAAVLDRADLSRVDLGGGRKLDLQQLTDIGQPLQALANDSSHIGQPIIGKSST